MESPALRRGRKQRKVEQTRAQCVANSTCPATKSKRCAGGPRRRKLSDARRKGLAMPGGSHQRNRNRISTKPERHVKGNSKST